MATITIKRPGYRVELTDNGEARVYGVAGYRLLGTSADKEARRDLIEEAGNPDIRAWVNGTLA